MIVAPEQVWLVVEPIDMRAGIDGLSARNQATLGRSPCDGAAYAFRNRRANRLKLLVWDSC
jgi:transposase